MSNTPSESPSESHLSRSRPPLVQLVAMTFLPLFATCGRVPGGLEISECDEGDAEGSGESAEALCQEELDGAEENLRSAQDTIAQCFSPRMISYYLGQANQRIGAAEQFCPPFSPRSGEENCSIRYPDWDDPDLLARRFQWLKDEASCQGNRMIDEFTNADSECVIGENPSCAWMLSLIHKTIAEVRNELARFTNNIRSNGILLCTAMRRTRNLLRRAFNDDVCPEAHGGGDDPDTIFAEYEELQECAVDAGALETTIGNAIVDTGLEPCDYQNPAPCDDNAFEEYCPQTVSE